MRSEVGPVTRIALLAFVAVVIWFLVRYAYRQPEVLTADAPVAMFSAERAEQFLARILGPEIPHPTNSVENADVRTRILGEFAALGVKTEVLHAFACNPEIDPTNVPCRTVNDIIADVVPGDGKAIVMMAHYDSVPAGPGASDDESGVAALIETARALRAHAGKSLHPVIALISDGEEAGLLGAKAFLSDAKWNARVGAVINLEARGSRGRSYLIEANPGNGPAFGPLLDLYSRSVPFYATNSFLAELYRLAPNNTDMTLFIEQGKTVFNFAFADNFAVYHTALDNRENLDKASLQAQGENLLGLASSLQKYNSFDLTGPKQVYADLFGMTLLRAPVSWLLPAALISLALLLVAAYRLRGETRRWRDWVVPLSAPPSLVLGAFGASLGLQFIARLVSGTVNPAYSYPGLFRSSLALCVLAVVLAAARIARTRTFAFSVYIWFATLALATSFVTPGISPYFLVPAIPIALVSPFLRTTHASLVETVVLAVSSLIALFLWLSAGDLLELFGTLVYPAVFVVPATLAAMTVIPLLGTTEISSAKWRGAVAATVFGAVFIAFVAGLQPTYTEVSPMRLNILYVEDAATGKANWAAATGAPLPQSLRAVAPFSPHQVLDVPGRYIRAYVAPAGAAHLASPSAHIVSDATRATGRSITLALRGTPGMASLFLMIPPDAMLRSFDLNGQHVEVMSGLKSDFTIACLSLDCVRERVTLNVATRKSFLLHFSANSYGAPVNAARLVAARPKYAVPSQDGDGTVVLAQLRVPNLN